MRIREIMTEPVETVGPDENATEAHERMRAGRIHHLVVVEGRTIVGVVSDRDLGGPRGDVVTDGLSVRDLMVESPTTVGPELHLKDAANLMRGQSIGCLPVVERGKLIGILTTADLLEAIGKTTEKPVEIGKRWTLRHRGVRPRTRAPRTHHAAHRARRRSLRGALRA